MRIYLSEITESPSEWAFDEQTAWVSSAVLALDENRNDRAPRPPGWKPKAREVKIVFRIHRSSDLYVVRVEIRSMAVLLCSRCGIGFDFALDREAEALYSQNLRYSSSGGKAHAEGADEITPLRGPFIDLREILAEQLALAIPIQPKPDLNEREECIKCGKSVQGEMKVIDALSRVRPFSKLKDFFQRKK